MGPTKRAAIRPCRSICQRYQWPQAMSRAKTVAEWAKEVGCHPETIRVAIRQKRLLARRLPLVAGNPYVITSEDWRAFIAKESTR